MKRHLIFSLGLLMAGSALSAADNASGSEPTYPGNPCFPGQYADPEGIVFDETVYIYPTNSLPFEEQTSMDCFSSTDLKKWTNHENIIDTTEVKWAWGHYGHRLLSKKMANTISSSARTMYTKEKSAASA